MKIIGITMGDPASIGPEITAKALSDPAVYERCRPLVVGDAAVMEEALKLTGLSHKLKIHKIGDVSEAQYEYGVIDVYDMGMVDMKELKRGEVSAMAGNAAFRYVKKVIELAMDKQVDATVTNALNKEAMNLAGHHYSGHTEIYADYTGTKKYTMMLAHENLRVVHVSTHVSLREACDRVKKDRILEVIRIAHQACRQLGIPEPKIGVAGSEGRRSRRSPRRSRRPEPRASWRTDRFRRTPFSPRPGAAGTTLWWPCTTTRDTFP